MIKTKIGNYDIRENAVEGKKELHDIASDSVITDIELVKVIATQALEAWWEHLAIDVSSVGKLAIESAFNAQSTLAGLILNSDAAVVDVNDVTIIIPAASLKDKINEFRGKVKACCDAWDVVLAGIKAATTIDEILALHPGEPIMEASTAPAQTGPHRFKK